MIIFFHFSELILEGEILLLKYLLCVVLMGSMWGKVYTLEIVIIK